MEITTRPAITDPSAIWNASKRCSPACRTTNLARMPLRDELDRACIAQSEQMPPDVVTMNSRVRCVVEPAGKEAEVTLVYPRDFTAAPGQLSVAAPAGVAVLGLAVGQQIDWIAPNGQTACARIVAIPYQPERAGDYMR